MTTNKTYWFVLALVVSGLGYLVLRSIFALPDAETLDARDDAASTPATVAAVPALAPTATWTKHVLGPFEATMPEPVRTDATSMAATVEDATIVIIQLTRDLDAGSMTLEARALELAKAISVELTSATTSAPVHKKYGTWDGIEVATTGTLDGRKRVHIAWIAEAGVSDAFAVVTTREAGKPVSEKGVERIMASIRQTRDQQPGKK